MWQSKGSPNPLSGKSLEKPSEQVETGTANLPEFDKSKYSVNDPASIWVIANKGRKLPSSYVPSPLVTPDVAVRDSGSRMREDAARALEKMFADAKQENLPLRITSGYRSYSYQVSVYNYYVATQGQLETDRTSARPGHSEHQTGLAVDISPSSRKCELDQCFAATPEGKWVAANAHKYGFIIRYPEDKESLTGYTFEPWHIRYVGLELAEKIYESNQTLEQFFGLPNYGDYPQNIYYLASGN